MGKCPETTAHVFAKELLGQLHSLFRSDMQKKKKKWKKNELTPNINIGRWFLFPSSCLSFSSSLLLSSCIFWTKLTHLWTCRIRNIFHNYSRRFKGSQFIVVSLKEGLFTNANVLFRVKVREGYLLWRELRNSPRHHFILMVMQRKVMRGILGGPEGPL